MSGPYLGRLERANLRDIWTSEPARFTLWLAEPKNLKILGDELGLDLVEKQIGSFWADIACRDISAETLG